MICENCKEKTATCYCQIKLDNKTVQKYLCQQCKALLVGNNEFSVNPEFQIKNQFCKNCGTTLKDFIASNYVGCEECYKEFEQIILQSLKSVRQSGEYMGKVPQRFAKAQEILNLEELLEKSMQNGDLNQVNRLNARLRELKGGNK